MMFETNIDIYVFDLSRIIFAVMTEKQEVESN